MATLDIFEPKPENLLMKLGFANSLMPHLAFYNKTRNDTFLVVIRLLPVTGKPTFFYLGYPRTGTQ